MWRKDGGKRRFRVISHVDASFILRIDVQDLFIEIRESSFAD